MGGILLVPSRPLEGNDGRFLVVMNLALNLTVIVYLTGTLFSL